MKVLYAFGDAASDLRGALTDRAHAILIRDRGVPRLTRAAATTSDDLVGFLLTASDEDVPDVVEAMHEALAQGGSQFGYYVRPVSGFRRRVNEVFAEHRVAFELSERGEMIPFTSRELHVAVVAPTLALLAGQPEFARVEHAFQEALSEMSKGKPSDAITDAGTALQEMLSAIGCDGNALGPLIADGKKRGLFQAHDQKLLEWVSADRSQFGDAHKVVSPTEDDARLTIHVVGALILRLSQGSVRGGD